MAHNKHKVLAQNQSLFAAFYNNTGIEISNASARHWDSQGQGFSGPNLSSEFPSTELSTNTGLSAWYDPAPIRHQSYPFLADQCLSGYTAWNPTFMHGASTVLQDRNSNTAGTSSVLSLGSETVQSLNSDVAPSGSFNDDKIPTTNRSVSAPVPSTVEGHDVDVRCAASLPIQISMDGTSVASDISPSPQLPTTMLLSNSESSESGDTPRIVDTGTAEGQELAGDENERQELLASAIQSVTVGLETLRKLLGPKTSVLPFRHSINQKRPAHKSIGSDALTSKEYNLLVDLVGTQNLTWAKAAKFFPGRDIRTLKQSYHEKNGHRRRGRKPAARARRRS